MLVKDLVTILLGLAEGADLYGDETSASEFRAMAAALKKQRKSLAINEAVTFWGGFSQRPNESQRVGSMSARRAADHLRVVATTAEPMAKKGAVSPLRTFLTFLQDQGDVDAVALVSEIVRPLPQKDWLVQLKAAGTNRLAFDAALDGLSKDKAVDAEALNAISAAYTGIKRKGRRKEVIERIRDQFESDAQYASKVDAIERMTGGR